MTPVVWTGLPERSVGVNFDCRAAATAAACKSAWPPTACAATTLPLPSTVTCTVTAPVARAALAIAGYTGAGLLTALPLRMPPDTTFFGLGNGVGAGKGLLTTVSAFVATGAPLPTNWTLL
jgi:hypothetical protein